MVTKYGRVGGAACRNFAGRCTSPPARERGELRFYAPATHASEGINGRAPHMRERGSEGGQGERRFYEMSSAHLTTTGWTNTERWLVVPIKEYITRAVQSRVVYSSLVSVASTQRSRVIKEHIKCMVRPQVQFTICLCGGRSSSGHSGVPAHVMVQIRDASC